MMFRSSEGAVDIVLSESFEPDRLRDAEAVCRAYGRLIELRQAGASSHIQGAASSAVTIAWQRWADRWGEQ